MHRPRAKRNIKFFVTLLQVVACICHLLPEVKTLRRFKIRETLPYHCREESVFILDSEQVRHCLKVKLWTNRVGSVCRERKRCPDWLLLFWKVSAHGLWWCFCNFI